MGGDLLVCSGFVLSAHQMRKLMAVSRPHLSPLCTSSEQGAGTHLPRLPNLPVKFCTSNGHHLSSSSLEADPGTALKSDTRAWERWRTGKRRGRGQEPM